MYKFCTKKKINQNSSKLENFSKKKIIKSKLYEVEQFYSINLDVCTVYTHGVSI